MAPNVRGNARPKTLERAWREGGSGSRSPALLPVAPLESRAASREFREPFDRQRRFGAADAGFELAVSTRRFAPGAAPFAPREGLLGAPRRAAALLGEFARAAFEAWRSGPHGFLLMGAGFLLGAGAPRRYFEIDRAYEVPMKEGDAPFVLGGKATGGEAPDLILDRGAPLPPRQAEVFRRGEELYVRVLASEPGNWLWHEFQWKRLEAGQVERLRAGDYLILGVAVEPTQFQEKARDRQPAVLHVDFGDGKGSFRLRASHSGLAGWAPGYPYFVSGYPVFARPAEKQSYHKGHPRYQYAFRLSWGERWDIWRARGEGRVTLLLGLLEKHGSAMPADMQRRYLQDAVDTAAGVTAKVPDRADRRADKERADQALAGACFAAGRYWNHHGDYFLADLHLRRAFETISRWSENSGASAELRGEIGEKLHGMHAWVAGRDANDGRPGDAGRHYEAAAEFVRFVRLLGPDDEAPPLYEPPLSAGEYLLKAAGYYFTAGPEYAEDLLRVTRKIQGLQEGASEMGPFR
ncbi:MAG: hypothetical protein IT572_06450 [Deltaproteobacteria bacterium]|nr:hypothetical protein [Deltaproteobacteria bacterium]